MTIYYVDGAVGDDANAGTSEGSGNAWATVDKAMNTVIAGDTVYVKSSATYNETVTLDTAGTTTAFITFEGYDSTPGDNGKATITTTGSSVMVDTLAGNVYYAFKNLIFSGASGTGVALFGTNAYKFVNCEFNNNGTRGVQVSAYSLFIDCIMDNNGFDGVGTLGDATVVGCVATNNGGPGIDCGGTDSMVYRCLTANNGNGSIRVDWGDSSVIGCTIDGNGQVEDGIITSSPSGHRIMDNILYDCNTGIEATAQNYFSVFVYNCFHNCVTDYDAGNAGQILQGYGDVAGNPNFTDEASGDYTLGDSASAALDVGVIPGGTT